MLASMGLPESPKYFMRKFLVTPDNAVESATGGCSCRQPFPLERVQGHFGLVYRGNEKRKVRLVVGGGSGHEPLFLGAVGPGMADAAVAGAVFAAPNPMSIQATADALGQADGIIYMYGNYSGDALNFDFAAEESESAGTKVAQIRVHDDIASAPPDRIAARRGTAGDIYVFKCTAAAADQGLAFDEVVRSVRTLTRRCGRWASPWLRPPRLRPASRCLICRLARWRSAWVFMERWG